MKSLNRIEISRAALIHNFELCRRLAGNAALIAMVKADAYGHGMIECARIFSEQGAAALGVAEAVEGLRLREAGLKLPILVLAGIIPQTLPAILAAGLTPVVVDPSILAELSGLARRNQVKVGLHLKLDAGMGRQGTLPEDFIALVQNVHSYDNLRLEGVMAHFPLADDRFSENSVKVLKIFKETAAAFANLNPKACPLHLANSGGLLYVPGSGFDMVRPGLALYGYYPDGSNGRAAASPPLLQRVMRFSSRVIQLRRVPAGYNLGYGHLFTTTRPSTIAVLPVGYDNGYLRCLTNKAQVLIHGRRFPVVGRISMNLTLIDVTGFDGICVGDEVVLMGQQDNEMISADEIAAWMDTISYEVLCLFGNLNERELVD